MQRKKPRPKIRLWLPLLDSNSAEPRAAFGSAQPRIASQFYPVRGFAAQGVVGGHGRKTIVLCLPDSNRATNTARSGLTGSDILCHLTILSIKQLQLSIGSTSPKSPRPAIFDCPIIKKLIVPSFFSIHLQSQHQHRLSWHY